MKKTVLRAVSIVLNMAILIVALCLLYRIFVLKELFGSILEPVFMLLLIVERFIPSTEFQVKVVLVDTDTEENE